MSLLILPNELLLCVAITLDSIRDLNALSQTNHRLHDLLHRLLYRQNIRSGGSSALLWAARHGHLRTMQLMVEEGADVEVEDKKGDTPLILASRRGFEEGVRLMLQLAWEDRIDVNHRGLHGLTALSWAARCHQLAIVKLLLGNYEVDPNACDSVHGYVRGFKRLSPLFWAVLCGCSELVALLLAKPTTNPQIKSPGGRTPLSEAAARGYYPVVKLFLEKLEHVIPDDHGATPLAVAASAGRDEVVKLFLESGRVDVETRDQYGSTALSRAAWAGKEGVVKLLLEIGRCDPNSGSGPNMVPPLILAASRGHAGVVQLLLSQGDIVNPDTADRWHETPLSSAAKNGHEATVRILLADGRVNPNWAPKHGETALALAIKHEGIVKLLLDHGANPDPRDYCGFSPLALAAKKGCEGTVKMFLETKRVDPNSKSRRRKQYVQHIARSGRTPLLLAASRGHTGVVKLLLDGESVDPDLADDEGDTPLAAAARRGHKAIVKLLLATGRVDPDRPGQAGKTALEWASSSWYYDPETYSLIKEYAEACRAKKRVGASPSEGIPQGKLDALSLDI